MRAKEVSNLLANRVEDVVRYLLPHGQRDGHEWCVGSINGEPGKSLKVHLSGSKAGVWCDFAKGGSESGDLLDLWRQIRNISLSEAISEAKQWLGIGAPKFVPSQISDFAKPKIKSHNPVNENSAVGKYLIEERKLTSKTIRKFNLYEENENIVFPFIRDGKLLQLKRLSLKRNNEKKDIRVEPNCEPCLFGWSTIPSDTRTIVITEGELDAMSLFQYGFPALSVPFGGGTGNKHRWLEYEYERLAIYDEIYLCLDNDEQGQAATIELAERLGCHRCRIVTLLYKDANACLVQGVTCEEIKNCFAKACTLEPAELKPASHYVDKVIQAFNPPDGHEIGFKPPWEKSKDKILFRPNELSIWTGINGHGKSQFIGQIALHSMAQNARVCIASLELKPERLLMRLTRQAAALNQPAEEYIRAIHEWYDDRLWIFDLVGTAKSKRLLEVFLYARQRYGIDVFIIDSLLKCDIAVDDYNAQKQFVERLCDFKNEHSCHIHLIAHPRKGVDEERTPGKLDIMGCGAMTDLADNCFCIWRNKKKEQKLNELKMKKEDSSKEIEETLKQIDCLWSCDKQRNGEWEGKVGLWFDPKSFQFLNHINQKPIRYVDYFKTNNDSLLNEAMTQ